MVINRLIELPSLLNGNSILTTHAVYAGGRREMMQFWHEIRKSRQTTGKVMLQKGDDSTYCF